MSDEGNPVWRILSRLFGPERPPRDHVEAPEPARLSVAIPVPEGLDPDATQRVPAALHRSDPPGAARRLADTNAALFTFEKARAELAGCVAYTWRTAGDADVCEVCRSRDGLRFHYADEPEHGHAGICRACPQGWCRCVAEPIIPGE